jgi:putative FmdB family regulatory protein
MPTYGYQCERCKEQFEVFQRITEPALTTHDGCGGELRRIMYPVGILFKGPGFYVNDYARNGNGKATATNGASTSSGEKSSTSADAAPAKTESATPKATEAKSPAGAAAK